MFGERYPPPFTDRGDAGRRLGEAVAGLTGLQRPIVLALPRGGVPIGYEVARRIAAPLDVLIVRKLGTPGQEELALGAVATGGGTHLNADLIRTLGVPEEVVEQIRRRELAEVDRRSARYRGERPWPSLAGRSVIVVDDGAATGATALAGIAALRPQGVVEIVVALPVAPRETAARLRQAADRVVCLEEPGAFYAIGSWYREFDQVSDDEVVDLLARAASAHGSMANR